MFGGKVINIIGFNTAYIRLGNNSTGSNNHYIRVGGLCTG